MTGVFGANAPDYLAAGLPCFPVDTRAKRPAVRNWRRTMPNATRAWAARFADADGLGVLMGAPSRITEIDVDAVGDAYLAAAIERFGDTPVVIRTASGKSKLWYRHAGERRAIRPVDGLPVDVLGDGFTIAPPSWREDLGAEYRFLSGSLADLSRLPTIRPGAVEARLSSAAETVQRGERNNRVWRWCMHEARACDDEETLVDAALTWASAMPEPLDPSETERCARSAWFYEAAGRNYCGLRRPRVSALDAVTDALSDEPDAFFLLALFNRYHSSRNVFAVSPSAMSKASNPPWHRSRIERARDVLLQRGYIAVVSPPDGRRRRAGRYRLAMSEFDNNHLTPSPLWSR